MENEKIFELMTKMYSEMQKEFGKVNDRFDCVESDIKGLKNEVLKTNIKLEQDIEPKIEALFDGYKQNTEQLVRLEDKVDNIQCDINNLNAKTYSSDTKIIELAKRIK